MMFSLFRSFLATVILVRGSISSHLREHGGFRLRERRIRRRGAAARHNSNSSGAGSVRDLGSLGMRSDIVSVHRNACRSVMAQARVDCFQIFARAVAKLRGEDGADACFAIRLAMPRCVQATTLTQF